IEEGLDLPSATRGDVYRGRSALLPTTLRDARTALVKSNMLRRLFGDDVVEHYARAAEWEIEEFNRVVTDYEVARGFERA
ncbi:MAG: glutamine synthetase, partial [Paracoccaceae bacterium]